MPVCGRCVNGAGASMDVLGTRGRVGLSYTLAVSTPEESLMQVFVVSDGTGDTGTATVRAAMLQFQSPWRLRVFGEVRHAREARRVISLAADAGALVVFSLVEGEVVETLQREAQQAAVVTVDLLGPMIAKVAQRLHTEPRHQPGLLHGISDDYFKRIEAVEFAVHHDDGANVHTLHEADIVLTGVSRTSKTPLCIYLAQRGYKTGNVPLVPSVDPPKELFELDKRKVFGLIIDAAALTPIRQARIRAIKASPTTAYTDSEAVYGEIEHALRLFRRNRWRTIDITGKAVEENASRIIEYLGYSAGM
ncbi:MAG: kinase/pyrophosphorylase [Deltaproteobacteria bacterium]|nr:kinase/pyrophosphorylase [Deltaproteobacteria bacterium]MBW2384001.1 kinase/pyrophosphorylase [Deltaproteobacteria bacterium]